MNFVKKSYLLDEPIAHSTVAESEVMMWGEEEPLKVLRLRQSSIKIGTFKILWKGFLSVATDTLDAWQPSNCVSDCIQWILSRFHHLSDSSCHESIDRKFNFEHNESITEIFCLINGEYSGGVIIMVPSTWRQKSCLTFRLLRNEWTKLSKFNFIQFGKFTSQPTNLFAWF